ncbi:MAG: hypothetical protein ABI315_14825 [Bacteroidia bacterium]
MKSICFFSSYFNQPIIPYYIRFYLDNLSPFFTKIIFITNQKVLHTDDYSYLEKNNIELLYVVNEGWDFGMWYKALKLYDVKNYDRVGLINDSCILLEKPTHFFNWLEKSEDDYCGMVDSNAISYHIQSYFVIINKRAIAEVYNYFMQNGLIINIKNVIYTYEIGLSSYLLNKGYKLGACYSTNDYKGEYSPTFLMALSLIKKGFPLIKKKIIFTSYRKDEYLTLIRMKFKLNPKYYINFIKENRNKIDIIDFDKLEVNYNLNFYLKLSLYKIAFTVYQIIREFKIKRT